MVFSSITFLYYFLPVVLLLYAIAPGKCKNFILLIASLFFYAWAEPKYVLLMVITILVGYFFGRMISISGGAVKKGFLVAGISLVVGSLFYFKYANFLLENYTRLTGVQIKALDIALPVGISFYSFQIISYLVDVYHGTVSAQKNVIQLGCYFTMFPQLIAGPILRYELVAKQLEKREHTISRCMCGVRRFVQGLAKKVLLANALGNFCEVLKQGEQTVFGLWLVAIAATLQIYFDFSGYSDMAIGLGKWFGFDFLENFDLPYMSKSITEFWRRWHMTLGSWFRDYVYIPLGGNRKGVVRTYFNILIVWALTGLWHGAAWNFVLWGLFYAVLLVVEKKWLLTYLQKTKWIGNIYTMFFVVIGFVIFNYDSMQELVATLSGMLGFAGLALTNAFVFYQVRSYFLILLVSAICATSLPSWCMHKLADANFKGKESLLVVLEPATYIAVLLFVTGDLISGSFNPFLYFRF